MTSPTTRVSPNGTHPSDASEYLTTVNSCGQTPLRTGDGGTPYHRKPLAVAVNSWSVPDVVTDPETSATPKWWDANKAAVPLIEIESFCGVARLRVQGLQNAIERVVHRDDRH